MFDVVISNGTVIDGTGTPAYKADVGIIGEKIEAIGDLSAAESMRIIDAMGHIVSPGFIDTHVHCDGPLLSEPQHASSLRQGVTTEILGQDGLSYAPLSPDNYRIYRRYLSGILGEPPEDLDMSNVTSFRTHYHNKTSVNTAYCVPHGAVRLESLGFRDVPLRGNDLLKAKRLVRESIEQGAVAFSTGLSYFPHSWSDTTELIELCREAHQAGAVYVTHLRNVNTDRAFGSGLVAEALEIGRRSGVSVHFSHYRTYPHTAGKLSERMELIDIAKSEGVDCTLELYPYPNGSSDIVHMLPGYAQEGGPDAILERLKDPSERKRLVDYFNNDYPPLQTDQMAHAAFDTMVFTNVPSARHLEGMNVPDVVADTGLSEGEIICNLLLENKLQVGQRGTPPHSTAQWRQVMRDCLELLSRPDYMVGSDSIPLGNLPHPRVFGTFPRLLGRLRRQFGVLSLEHMLQRMTDNPARRFGLKNRGRIEMNNYADITVFDSETIMDNSTYDDPCQYPTGIPFVLVNGEIAVDQGKCTGVLAGQAVP